MTNLPKKITFAYDYIIKKTTTKPNALKQKRDHFRQKSTVWFCRDTGRLALPGWVCHSLKGSGVRAGVAGFLGAPAPAWGLVPIHQVQRAQPKYVGPRHGAATHFGHVSGAPEPAKLWHGHAEVTSENVFSENSSHLVVKIE